MSAAAHSLDCIACGAEDSRTREGHLWCRECYLDAEELFCFNPEVRHPDELL